MSVATFVSILEWAYLRLYELFTLREAELPFSTSHLNFDRSEGIPLRDISSLGAMDWGLARLENSSAAVAVAAVAAVAAAAVALWMEGDDL